MRIEIPQNPKLTAKLLNEQQSLAKPPWMKIRPPTTDRFVDIKKLLKEKKLNTVCAEARCPNISECWSGGTATFMIMGDTCTRACRFCMVKSGNPKGVLDPEEPKNLVEAVKIMNLEYVVLTCVTRDDLPDGGAKHWVDCLNALKKAHPKLIIELLISDLDGNLEALEKIVRAGPNVLAHNLETVERLQSGVRDPRANYQKSMSILREAKRLSEGSRGSCFAGNLEDERARCPEGERGRELSEVSPLGRTSVPAKQAPRELITKTSLMVGLGETEEEVIQTMKDCRAIGVDVITFGQYLRPSPFHLPIHEYVKPEQFQRYKTLANGQGFLYSASGPFVRSSYKAGELFLKNIFRKSQHVSRQIRSPQKSDGPDPR